MAKNPRLGQTDPPSSGSFMVEVNKRPGTTVPDTDQRADQQGLPATRHRHLVRLAHRFVWNRWDAEDAVQSALAIAHQTRAELGDYDVLEAAPSEQGEKDALALIVRVDTN